jgi:hypothetical protein
VKKSPGILRFAEPLLTKKLSKLLKDVGDVTNQPARFEPTAGREGTLAAGNALNSSKDSIDYDTVPFTVFTDPQLAGEGYIQLQLLCLERIIDL